MSKYDAPTYVQCSVERQVETGVQEMVTWLPKIKQLKEGVIVDLIDSLTDEVSYGWKVVSIGHGNEMPSKSITDMRVNWSKNKTRTDVPKGTFGGNIVKT